MVTGGKDLSFVRALLKIYGNEDYEILMAYLLSSNPEKQFRANDHLELKLLVDQYYS